jgi:hypothetical protein
MSASTSFDASKRREMPFAHRLKHSSCSRVKRVVNDAGICDGLAIGNDFSARGCVISQPTVANVIMLPYGTRALDGWRTGGSFWGTNELLSTVNLGTRSDGGQSQNRLARGLTIAATRSRRVLRRSLFVRSACCSGLSPSVCVTRCSSDTLVTYVERPYSHTPFRE